MRKHSINCRTISFICLFLLTSCSSWNEEFEDKVVRAYPKASIHKISKMVDKGIIKETDDDSFVSGTFSEKAKTFRDGNISRGAEDVRRLYMLTYEDASKNLHAAHHLYFIAKPAKWNVK